MSFTLFEKRMRLRAKQVEVGASRVQRRTALAIVQAVVLATPVDTGRARGNWQASIDTPIDGATDAEDKSGNSTIQAAAGVIAAARPRQRIILSNNLSYIVPLNEGSSAKAPAMFVEAAVAQGKAAVARERIFI